MASGLARFRVILSEAKDPRKVSATDVLAGNFGHGFRFRTEPNVLMAVLKPISTLCVY
jgi:hypothetical protein